MPGPACYGRGGDRATVTDANLILGYLDPAGFNAGRFPLHPERSSAAIERTVARPLGSDVVTAARGIHDLANMRMGSAIRMVTLQRGTDPRGQAIVAFGGAGPLHVVRLAQLFDIPEAIVPAAPGVKSAYGLLVSDLASDHVRTEIADVSRADPERLRRIFAELEQEGRAALGEAAESTCVRSLDMRYAQKAQTHNVPLFAGEVTTQALERAESDFRRAQFAFYGTHSEDRCQIVSLRVRVTQRVEKPELPALRALAIGPSDARKGMRRAYFAEALGFVDTPVYAREKLPPGERFQGPALIEEPHSTTVCPPGVLFSVDPFGNLLIRNPPR
jgi:N-methylhydantoinase A